MIKINLLDSVTERSGGTVLAVERKVGSPTSRLLLMTLAVGFLLAAVIGLDIINSQMNLAKAQSDLDEQKKIAAELEAVMKEQKELEQKIANIDARIEAIKKLRANQAGPSAVLEALKERIAMVPALYLESVEQTGDQVTIKGNSPDEAQVTQFGRSLEFSSGLFSNLSIETQRKEVQNQQVSANAGDAAKLELVNFTIRCAYTPSNGNASKEAGATTAQNLTPSPGGNKNQAPGPQTGSASGSDNPTTPPVAKNQDK